jgi:hypothetical protein
MRAWCWPSAPTPTTPTWILRSAMPQPFASVSPVDTAVKQRPRRLASSTRRSRSSRIVRPASTASTATPGLAQVLHRVFADHGDVEAHVVPALGHLDHHRARPAQFTGAQDRGIGALEGLHREDGAALQDHRLADIKSTGGLGHLEPERDVGLLLGRGRAALLRQAGRRHGGFHEGLAGRRVHANLVPALRPPRRRWFRRCAALSRPSRSIMATVHADAGTGGWA